MATYYKPYPPEASNRPALWVEYAGADLLTYYTPRGDPSPRYDRFVDYLVDFVPFNPFAQGAAPVPVPIPALPSAGPTASLPSPAPVVPTPAPSQAESIDRSAPERFAKPVASSSRHGYDRLITFADGTQKILGNWYLPHLPEPSALANGEYAFGTNLDPEIATLAGRRPTRKWLFSDRRDGTDRLAIYSDGSSQRAVNWYVLNPQYGDTDGDIPVVEITVADPRSVYTYADPVPPRPVPVADVPPAPVGTVLPGGAVVGVVPPPGALSAGESLPYTPAIVPAPATTVPAGGSLPAIVPPVAPVAPVAPAVSASVPGAPGAPVPTAASAQTPVILGALAVAVALFVFRP